MASVEKIGAIARTTSFGRKRVALSSDVGMAFENDSPVKRSRSDVGGKNSGIGDLPLDILIKIVCGVDHDDLKSLFFVSKSIRTAASSAKQSHFAYSTPRKNNSMLKNDMGKFFNNEVEVEAPNAPKQSRIRRSRLDGKKLADISVSLFASETDIGRDCWPKSLKFASSITRVEI